MKVHYINILLFAHALNILVNTHKNKSCTTPHHSPTTRSLCECDLYIPNYDNDAQMKEVMENFNKQTQQRFHEYDERMKTTRQKCKEQCDKEIQKIILKDKLEKEITEKLTTLETKIDTNDIPTCICEKSLADKVEKGCLRCGYGLGTVAPTVGLIGAVAVHVWKPLALKAAIAAAIAKSAAEISAAANAAGKAAGVKTVIAKLKALNILELCPQISKSFFNTTGYNEASKIYNVILHQHVMKCGFKVTDATRNMCSRVDRSLGIFLENGDYGLPTSDAIDSTVKNVIAVAEKAAAEAAEAARETVTTGIRARETAAINTIYMGKQTAIIASIVAIVVIVLIMVIIYLILRYRRKKKMKKKLQYIKLLKE
ncbi:rifin [Plasmodium falciparum IGH-CR14]|uniref:Rifin n=1 Tax=Plasmodium falciparum IGH-CR14 TaxID=580059 RepID=A0A0L1I3G4_PLAFA|nr:rifin [Plasmodium falciparum IGH-CR14]